MFDNIIKYKCVQRIILHPLLSIIVKHCRLKKTRGMIILYLTTILTMIDNDFNNIHVGKGNT